MCKFCRVSHGSLVCIALRSVFFVFFDVLYTKVIILLKITPDLVILFLSVGNRRSSDWKLSVYLRAAVDRLSSDR